MCSDQVDESIAAAHEALDLRTEIADVGAQAQTLMLLGTVLWCPGYVDEANSAARQAVALLEQHRPEPQALAEAYCEMAGLALDAEDIENALSWAGRALAVLPDPGDEETEIHSRCIIALAHLLKDDPDAPFEIERIRARSLRAGLPEQVCRADENLIWLARRQRDYERVTACLEPALKYASEHGMELWRGYLLAHRAQLELDLGRWDDAAQTAWLILGEPRRSRVPKIIALGVVGRLRARRRDPDLWPVLDMAHDLSNISQELVAAEPVAVARAEAAWLEGDFDRVALETTPAFELARKRSSRYVVAELAVWRRRAGLEDELAPHEVAGPYALELSGAFTEAAARWAALGCQYDAAMALAHSNEPDARRVAVQQLQRLGASAAVAMITRRLRQRGVRRIPRGPQKRTGVNPGGVTARELEVLRLLAAGLQNAEIAANLVVSQKTVDHHVSAILRKLSVRNRVAAVAEATRLGLMAPEGSSRR
jgi:DNA-binding CsgD family transcriptional regulator/tetratricopeptide (TPR) repeat protein